MSTELKSLKLPIPNELGGNCAANHEVCDRLQSVLSKRISGESPRAVEVVQSPEDAAGPLAESRALKSRHRAYDDYFHVQRVVGGADALAEAAVTVMTGLAGKRSLYELDSKDRDLIVEGMQALKETLSDS